MRTHQTSYLGSRTGHERHMHCSWGCVQGAFDEEKQSTIKAVQSSKRSENILLGLFITAQPKATALGLQQNSAAISLPAVNSARGLQYM